MIVSVNILAFVKYEDKYKAILPITLVKAFKPKGEEDFERNKKVQAYWKSEDENIQGYYPAFVHAFAGCHCRIYGAFHLGDFDTMRLKLKTLREPFPRTMMWIDMKCIRERQSKMDNQRSHPIQ